MTRVRPSESMSVRIPSIGEPVLAAGVPLAGTLIDAVPTGPGVVLGVGRAGDGAGGEQHGRSDGHAPPEQPRPKDGRHAGPRPVPLLPGLTAGSPAAHRGQVSAPGS